MEVVFRYTKSRKDFTNQGIKKGDEVLHLGWTGFRDGVVVATASGQVFDIDFDPKDWDFTIG